MSWEVSLNWMAGPAAEAQSIAERWADFYRLGLAMNNQSRRIATQSDAAGSSGIYTTFTDELPDGGRTIGDPSWRQALREAVHS